MLPDYLMCRLWCYLLTMTWVVGGAEWFNVNVTGGTKPNKRDETGSFVWQDKQCLFGGRGMQSIDCFDPVTRIWKRSKTQTNDIHHAQPIFWKGEAWIVAAWHGPYPAGERQIPNILIFNPATDKMRTGCAIPKIYARGAAGCVVYKDIFYLVNGAVNGHVKKDGAYAYRNFTRLDPATCTWSQMPSRPAYNRDHFQASVIGSKIIIAGGRDSPHGDNVFHYTTGPTEWFDLEAGENEKWHEGANITTFRAGTSNVVDDKGRLIIIGGESDVEPSSGAFKTVERYDLKTNKWTKLPSMLVGRHTAGASLYQQSAESCTSHSDIDCKDQDMPNGTHDGVSDSATCCALCVKQAGCKAYTVYPDRKVCYLKSSCEGYKFLKGAVSGGEINIMIVAAGVGKMGGGPQLDDTEELYYGSVE